MYGLRLYTSNRLEILVQELASLLRRPLALPLDPEIIMVQSKGMERWVSMELARRNGICANIEFPFPNRFLQRVFDKVLPGISDGSSFHPDILAWRFMRLLPSLTGRPGFESLKNYLQDSANLPLKSYQLCRQIADTFDQYTVFRPKMILQWERGYQEHWQAVLWRELVKEGGDLHRASLAELFLKTVRETNTAIEGLPERISVFGISAIPEFHMRILYEISKSTQVNLFLVNPSREYWGDIVSDREARRISTSLARDSKPEGLHLEKGNSLLGSMGALGRDFLDLVMEFPSEERNLFEQPDEPTLLSSIQSDILNLRDPRERPVEKRIVLPGDLSLQIHSCHSPMREMEVLQDNILSMLDNDPTLDPGEILVMAPDIRVYSPYIEAVFGLPDNDPRRVPFTVADRSYSDQSEIIDVFLSILDLRDKRFGASYVMDILETGSVRKRFNIPEQELDVIRQWVIDTRIRWGRDGKDREELGLPGLEQNTWKSGLERLLLGYALPGCEENLFNNLLPYDHIEGQESLLLGRFSEFLDRLCQYVSSLHRSRSLKNWSRFLGELLEAFFLPDENSLREIHVLRRLITDLARDQDLSGFDEPIDTSTIRWHLGQHLERQGPGSGFLGGGITFCSMLPMRSIPFKLICVVGMNNDSYPRESKTPGFDLLAKHPQPGDRSRVKDDRYLFLETLLSARQRLYISYVGQNVHDNSPIPPSALVSELMDYVEEGFESEEGGILDLVTTTHRLQPFSPAYFKDTGRLFSYSQENLEAAREVSKSRQESIPFISTGLPLPENDLLFIDVDDLCRFFANPARFLLDRRLGMHLHEATEVVENDEPFEPSGLERYHLTQTVAESVLQGRDPDEVRPLARASGTLPHGSVGECFFQELRDRGETFAQKTAGYVEKDPLEPLKVDLTLSGVTLTGELRNIYPERLILYRCARVRAKDRIRIWIYHLLLSLLGTPDYPRESMLIGLDPRNKKEMLWKAWQYSRIEEPEVLLQNLLARYRQGMIRPTRFFPESSWEYVRALFQNGKSKEEALRRAKGKWAGSDFSRGECDDPYYQLCFRGDYSLDPEFEEISRDILRPLLEHQEEVKA